MLRTALAGVRSGARLAEATGSARVATSCAVRAAGAGAVVAASQPTFYSVAHRPSLAPALPTDSHEAPHDPPPDASRDEIASSGPVETPRSPPQRRRRKSRRGPRPPAPAATAEDRTLARNRIGTVVLPDALQAAITAVLKGHSTRALKRDATYVPLP